jgi:predicted transcriptional regulator
MGKHRSRIKILAKILSVVHSENGAKKTHIMYQAYLSYKLLTLYLNDLIKARLIVADKDNYYMLTAIGEKFLIKFTEYSKLNKYIEDKVNHIEDQKLELEKMCPNSK